MTVKDIKEINRAMSMGETKMRRAKKDMVEANLRSRNLDCKEIYKPWLTIFRPNSRRQHWS